MRINGSGAGSSLFVTTWQTAVVSALRDVQVRLHGSVSDPDNVHALRRAAKQVRALVLLAPPFLIPLARATRAGADTLRRSLGDSRDAAVRRQTFEHLADGAGPQVRSLAVLLDDVAPSTDTPAVPVGLAGEITALIRNWSCCDLSGIGNDSLVAAVAGTYKRARTRKKHARDGTTDRMHRWRRAVVDMDLQLGAFASHAPQVARMARKAHKLRDLLGRVHDIDALLEVVNTAPTADPQAVAALTRSADRERRRLRREVKRNAKRLFEDRTALWKDGVAGAFYAASRVADAGARMRSDSEVARKAA